MSEPKLSILRRPSDNRRCVYCHDTLPAAPLICPECRTALHPECFAEVQNCPNLGCSATIADALGQNIELTEPVSVSYLGWKGAVMAVMLAVLLSSAVWRFLFRL